MSLKPVEQLLLFLMSGHKIPLQDQFSQHDNIWLELFDLCLKHGVLSIVYNKIKRRTDKLSVDEQFFTKARAYYIQVAEHNILLYHNLERILDIICAAKIPVIALKGAYINEIVYRNIAMRTMADVDLLFKQQDLPKAQILLQKAGWLSKHNGILLDIHCELTHDLPINMEGIWKRAEPALVANHSIWVLSPEDMLIATCLHLSYHHLFESSGLRSLADVAEIIQFYAERINWETVYQRSLEWGVVNAVFLSLLLAKDLLDADIPHFLMIKLQPHDFSTSQQEWALSQIFADKLETSRNLSQYFWKLFSKRSFFEKLKMFRQLTLPSSEALSQKYLTVSGSLINYTRYLTRLKQNFSPYMKALWDIAANKDDMKHRLLHENRKLDMKQWMSTKRSR